MTTCAPDPSQWPPADVCIDGRRQCGGGGRPNRAGIGRSTQVMVNGKSVESHTQPIGSDVILILHLSQTFFPVSPLFYSLGFGNCILLGVCAYVCVLRCVISPLFEKMTRMASGLSKGPPSHSQLATPPFVFHVSPGLCQTRCKITSGLVFDGLAPSSAGCSIKYRGTTFCINLRTHQKWKVRVTRCAMHARSQATVNARCNTDDCEAFSSIFFFRFRFSIFF